MIAPVFGLTSFPFFCTSDDYCVTIYHDVIQPTSNPTTQARVETHDDRRIPPGPSRPVWDRFTHQGRPGTRNAHEDNRLSTIASVGGDSKPMYQPSVGEAVKAKGSTIGIHSGLALRENAGCLRPLQSAIEPPGAIRESCNRQRNDDKQLEAG
jgi:hypothetical protein